MRKKRKLALTALLLILSIQFSPKKKIVISKPSIQVWKHMDMYCLPYTRDDHSFWEMKEELALLPYFDYAYDILYEFINEMIEKEKKNPNTFSSIPIRDMKYAFIISHQEKIDTLYADIDLRLWLIKRKDKESYRYYYSDTGFVKKYDLNIPFFSNCW
ncbi:MAG: hypothetical protein GXO27_05740 [Chlorobi bacterium]|nr:hypothetical protein [Chlorobiota bacterium]